MTPVERDRATALAVAANHPSTRYHRILQAMRPGSVIVDLAAEAGVPEPVVLGRYGRRPASLTVR